MYVLKKMFSFLNILRYSTHLIFLLILIGLHASAYMDLEFRAYLVLRLWCCFYLTLDSDEEEHKTTLK